MDRLLILENMGLRHIEFFGNGQDEGMIEFMPSISPAHET